SPWQGIEHMGQSLAILIELLLPLFAVILLAAIAGSLMLGGWLFYPAGVLPKLSKISPIAGIKRMFSIRSLVELLKS
ncbi:EscU/YscU/HrcU family type III secretion system export apparatus switch protein, partial [Photobacterium sp. R1]